jgi:hypothetical protein
MWQVSWQGLKILVRENNYPVYITLYRVSQEECARLRENVPNVKVHRYNPKHLYPKLNGYRDNVYVMCKLEVDSFIVLVVYYFTQLPPAGHHNATTGLTFNTVTSVVYAVQNTSPTRVFLTIICASHQDLLMGQLEWSTQPVLLVLTRTYTHTRWKSYQNHRTVSWR